MKSKFRLGILKFLCLALCSSILFGGSAFAAEDDVGSITVNFAESGVSFELYYAADKTETGYQASEKFQSCAVDYSTAAADLRTLAATLDACVTRDGITPDAVSATDSLGKAVFSDLQPGLYLLRSPGKTTASVVSIAGGQSMTIDPKAEPTPEPEPEPTPEPTPEPELISISVVKVWEDEGKESERPEEITIQLYQDNELFDSVVLNEDNNWKYVWESMEKDHSYSAVEETVPEQYSMSVSQDGNSFVVKNTIKQETPAASPEGESTDSKLPKTGQLWWPVDILVIAGVLALIIGGVKWKRSKHEE